MHLESIRKHLVEQLNEPESQSAYAVGRLRHTALQPFGTPNAAIDHLNTRGRPLADERSRITAALIAEAQRGEQSCWCGFLLLAFFPGVLRLRSSTRHAHFTSDELNALVVESFLEAVSKLPLATQSRCAVVNLMLTTRKNIFQRLERETARVQHERHLLLFGYPDFKAESTESPEDISIIKELERHLAPKSIRSWLKQAFADEDPGDVQLLLDTHASGRSLIDWMREHLPDLDAASFNREYGRLRRRRSRLLNRLRKRLRLTPHGLVEALASGTSHTALEAHYADR